MCRRHVPIEELRAGEYEMVDGDRFVPIKRVLPLADGGTEVDLSNGTVHIFGPEEKLVPAVHVGTGMRR